MKRLAPMGPPAEVPAEVVPAGLPLQFDGEARLWALACPTCALPQLELTAGHKRTTPAGRRISAACRCVVCETTFVWWLQADAAVGRIYVAVEAVPLPEGKGRG